MECRRKQAAHALTEDECHAQTLLVMRRDVTPSLALNCFADKLRAHFQWTDDDTNQHGGLATSYRAAGAWRLTQRIALHVRASANIMHFGLR